MRHVSGNVVEKIETHFMFHNFFENRAVYEMWKNTVEPDWPQMTIWRMRTATNPHSEHIILIDFPLQQWLQ